MPYEIRLSAEAVADMKRLRDFDRAAIMDQIGRVLAVNPTLESRARLKRLEEPAPTGYRLRVGNFRVFYDVEETQVFVVRVLSKEQAVLYQRGPRHVD